MALDNHIMNYMRILHKIVTFPSKRRTARPDAVYLRLCKKVGVGVVCSQGPYWKYQLHNNLSLNESVIVVQLSVSFLNIFFGFRFGNRYYHKNIILLARPMKSNKLILDTFVKLRNHLVLCLRVVMKCGLKMLYHKIEIWNVNDSGLHSSGFGKWMPITCVAKACYLHGSLHHFSEVNQAEWMNSTYFLGRAHQDTTTALTELVNCQISG